MGEGLHREYTRSSERHDRSRRHPCRFWVRHSTLRPRERSLSLSPCRSLVLSVRDVLSSVSAQRRRYYRSLSVPVREKPFSEMFSPTNPICHTAVARQRVSATRATTAGCRKPPCQAMPRASRGSRGAASVGEAVNVIRDPPPARVIRSPDEVGKVGRYSVGSAAKSLLDCTSFVK